MSFELGQSAVGIRSKILRSGYCSRKGAGCVPALRWVFTSVVGSAFPLSIGKETEAQAGSGLSLRCPYCRKDGRGPGSGELCWMGR